MATSRKYSTIRTGFGAVAAAALLLTLAACGRPPAPDPQLVTVGFWWETSPETQLNRYSQVQIEVTFKSLSAMQITFLGDTGTNQPEDEIQIWSAPNVGSIPVAFDEFPMGDYATGAEMTWKMTFDLSALANTENKVAIRPAPAAAGTLTPTALEMTAATLIWVR
jgi:hypothetical protein